jgi:hypothetical protein
MKITSSVAIAVFALSSCTTYYMSTDSLKSQLQGINPEKIHEAYDYRLGMGLVFLQTRKNFYNGIESIDVTDKQGRSEKLPVNNHTSVRLTTLDGRRVIVYFDSMFLLDTLICGSKSHFITLPIHRNIDSIAKVEVQK